tara:strand:+ start:62 stop:376 length:315 start_codon:yes stop_codon:yes gene_type:complete
MEPKKTKKIGKGTIFFNHNASEKAPRYKARIEMDEGSVYEIPLWFNGTAGQEGFRIGLNIEEVLNPQSRTQKPISAEEAKEGFDKVRAQMAEGEPPKEEDDVPF